MSEHERMLDPEHAPTPAELADWMGRRNVARWNALARFISSHYPGVFEPRWSFAGKRHGWSLRYHRSKALCTLLPERGRFNVIVVLGAADRARVQALLPALTSHVRADYEGAETYPDGKWVRVNVDGAQVLADVERLLLAKRTPPHAAPRRTRARTPRARHATRAQRAAAPLSPRSRDARA